jgi:DNA invertase Pin-like site-specific DNA recombinase
VKTVAVYLRVSTQDQSTDLQRQEIVRHLELRDLPTASVVVYEDQGCTGTNGNRPELRRLLADCRAGTVGTVVCWKLDRLFRSLRDLIATLQLFSELGVEFVSVRDSVDLSTSTGRLTMHLIGAFAEFEAALIRERTRAGLAAARRRGARIGRPPVKRDAAVVVGLRSNGLSVRQIAAELGMPRSAVHRVLSRKAG